MPSALKWAIVAVAATTALTGVILPALLVPQPAMGDALAPDGAPASGVAQADCTGTDDVEIVIMGLADFDNGYVLKDPPDYEAGASIWIYFDVTNNSCQEVSVTVGMTGSVSKAAIYTTTDPDHSQTCFSGCEISAIDKFTGNVGWDLSKHPNASKEKVVACSDHHLTSGFHRR